MNKSSLSGLKVQVVELIDFLRGALFPEIFDPNSIGEGHEKVDRDTAEVLLRQIMKSIMSVENPENATGESANWDATGESANLDATGESANWDATGESANLDEKCKEIASLMIQSLSEIKAVLMTDVQAAYEGDPAAKSTEEVMLAYPGFEAISIFRLAHRLYELKVPIIPRMMTEYAHQITGIDIHPGATIGQYFFIDHGTGVVIGETTTIGEHVKLYQGVTLGAKSFDVNPDGTLVKGIKRHPDLGDYVVVYAGATVLGGNTRIGDHCVIGGNVWLTHSVEAGSKVMAAQAQNDISTIS